MNQFIHGLVAVFRPPPARHIVDDPVKNEAVREIETVKGELLNLTSSVRATTDRVCRRLAGLNGFDHDPPAAP